MFAHHILKWRNLETQLTPFFKVGKVVDYLGLKKPEIHPSNLQISSSEKLSLFSWVAMRECLHSPAEVVGDVWWAWRLGPVRVQGSYGCSYQKRVTWTIMNRYSVATRHLLVTLLSATLQSRKASSTMENSPLAMAKQNCPETSYFLGDVPSIFGCKTKPFARGAVVKPPLLAGSPHSPAPCKSTCLFLAGFGFSDLSPRHAKTPKTEIYHFSRCGVFLLYITDHYITYLQVAPMAHASEICTLDGGFMRSCVSLAFSFGSWPAPKSNYRRCQFLLYL